MAVGVQKLSQSHSSQRQPQQFPAGQALLLIVPRNDLVLQALAELLQNALRRASVRSVCDGKSKPPLSLSCFGWLEVESVPLEHRLTDVRI